MGPPIRQWRGATSGVRSAPAKGSSSECGGVVKDVVDAGLLSLQAGLAVEDGFEEAGMAHGAGRREGQAFGEGVEAAAEFDSALAKAALCMAPAVRGGDVDGVIFHFDKDGEYVGDLFATPCSTLRVTQWMGRVGSALDNAASESWNSILEHALLSLNTFETKDQARRAIAAFIDMYNTHRRHSSCEMLAPVAYEALLAERAADTKEDRAA